MFHLPIAQQIYLAGVICAFAMFAVGLAGGQIYVWLGARKPVAVARAREATRMSHLRPAR